MQTKSKKDYEVVREDIKVTSRFYDAEDNLREHEKRVRKIGKDWVETNSDTFKVNPSNGRLEMEWEYNGIKRTEYLIESLEEIKVAHDKVRTFNVGDGVHYSVGSDTYPGTVIEIKKKGRVVVVQEDQCVSYHKDIHTEMQDWDFVKNPNGAVREFWRKQDGYYKPKGSKFSTLYHGRAKYYDPHF